MMRWLYISAIHGRMLLYASCYCKLVSYTFLAILGVPMPPFFRDFELGDCVRLCE
jgi:hypothetical protein